MNWETVIGLEIHAQLATRSKIFSGASTAYGAAPNAQANLVDLGYPGVLPVLNREAVRMAVKFGLAIGAQRRARARCSRARTTSIPTCRRAIRSASTSCRSCEQGTAATSCSTTAARKTVGITRAHLEEDAGKSLHEDFQGLSGIDLNRAGTPLLEIVSEPDMRSAKEAGRVHEEDPHAGALPGDLRRQHAGRLVPLRRQRLGAPASAQEKLGTRCEIKNLNSFRFVEKAINYEVARQIEVIEGGGKIRQETRLYDPDKGETRACAARKKRTTTATSPIPTCCRSCSTTRSSKPCARRCRSCRTRRRALHARSSACPLYDAGVLTASREIGDYYEAVVGRRATAAREARRELGHGRALGRAQQGRLEVTQSRIDAAAPRRPAGAHRRRHHLGQDRQGSVRADVG